MKSNKKAFTLIELAIVLIIIGILMGAGVSIYSILVKRSKIKETQNIINSDIEIIKTFTFENKRIPNNDEFDKISTKNKDIWDKNLTYRYDKNLTNKNSLCYEKNTSLQITICENSDCSKVQKTINNVAFLILSNGENLNKQTDTSKDNIKIYIPGVKVDDDPSDTNNPQKYDDLVKWVTLEELQNNIDCSEEKLHIINNSIPYGYQNEDYNATIYATGGLQFQNNGKYKWCYEGQLPKGLKANPNFHSNNCLNDIDFWENADNFNISGKPKVSGDYKIKVYVADKLNNVDKKFFVITINPSNNNISQPRRRGHRWR